MEVFFQLLINGILLGGIYGLVSMGLTLIFGVMKIVNFAHGEFLMLGMYGAFWLFHLLGIQPYVSILIMMPAMFALGLLVQRGLIQRLIDAPGITQIFVTVGLSMALQNGDDLFNYRRTAAVRRDTRFVAQVQPQTQR